MLVELTAFRQSEAVASGNLGVVWTVCLVTVVEIGKKKAEERCQRNLMGLEYNAL